MAERTLRGRGVSPGVALGAARGEIAPHDANPRAPVASIDRASEEARLTAAWEAARDELRTRQDTLRRAGQDEAASIFAMHATLLDDPALRDAVDQNLAQGQDAAQAVRAAAEGQAAALQSLDDAYLRERAMDVRDVGDLLLRRLGGADEAVAPSIEGPAVAGPGILIATDLGPSAVVGLPARGIVGIALARGAATGHAAIIARSLALPMVTGLGERILQVVDGEIVALDGGSGDVVVHPSGRTRGAYAARAARHERRRACRADDPGGPAETTDGQRVALLANVAGVEEAALAARRGAEGIGLLRSEFLFLDRREPPGEDEQALTYRRIAEEMRGHPVTLRTLDAGGDKPLPYLPLPREENPALGLRGVRATLAWPDVMLTQLRAALRAADGLPLRVMVPMVATVEEVRATRGLLDEARRGLAEREVPHADTIELGVMVETPAAAVMADALGREAAFFSIGTNDLTQYIMACDRGNDAVAALYQPAHPAVLRLIRTVVTAAAARGRPVAVCGEMAGDPTLALLLVGLGVGALSMAPLRLPDVRAAIRAHARSDLARLAQEACGLASAADVLALATERLGAGD